MGPELKPPTTTGGLECMHCHKPVPDEDGRVFAEVFVCASCYTIAERLYHRLEAELRRLLAMSKETIRIGLIEGKLSFESAPAEEVSKAELLQMIVKMQER
jgi:hypothetical protein